MSETRFRAISVEFGLENRAIWVELLRQIPILNTDKFGRLGTTPVAARDQHKFFENLENPKEVS